MLDDLKSRAKGVQRKIWRSVWTYAQNHKGRDAKSKARASLKDIALAAICLDLDLKKHTAEMFFLTRSCRTGVDFAPERMEEIFDQEGQGRVRLVVSPPLYRQTQSRGHAQSLLIKKAQVCSGILKRLPRNGLQKVLSPIYTEPRAGSLGFQLIDGAHMERRASQESGKSFARCKQ